jgi:hypothetical protein
MSYCTRLAIRASMLGILLLGLNSTIQAQNAMTPSEELRVFQSRDGETQYVGKLLKLNGSRVTLQPEEGEPFDLRMSDLSRGDQLWIRNADRAMRLIEKHRGLALEMIQDLADAKSEREVKSLCIKLREYGELAADAQLQLQGLMMNPANGEIAYHAAVTFAVVSPKTPENWNELLTVLKEGNPQLLLLTQRAPGPMFAGMSLFGQQAFPLLQAAAYTGEISLEPTEWSAAELEKLNTVRGPKNAARASACLAIGDINSDASRSVINAVIKEAAVKLNGMADGATIEACLASMGKLGYSDASETLEQYEDQFPATVEKSRELIALAQERKRMLQELAKLRATHLFTDRRGNRVRASLENLSDGRVRLKKLDDKFVVVPLEDFSDDDQAWILAKIEARNKPMPEPEVKSSNPAEMPLEPATQARNFDDIVVNTRDGKRQVDPGHPILEDCVGWWPLTDGMGDKAADVSGYGRDALVVGGVTWEDSDRGSVVKLNGVDAYLDLGALEFDPSLKAGFTFSAWVQPEESNFASNRLWWVYRNGKAAAATVGIKYVQSGGAGQLSAYLQDGGSGNHLEGTTATAKLADWNHIVLTYVAETGDLVLVANATLVANSNTGGGLRGGNANHHLGAYLAKDEFFKGRVQNVRIFDRVLDAAEIKQLYEDPFIGLKPIEDSVEDMK